MAPCKPGKEKNKSGRCVKKCDRRTEIRGPDGRCVVMKKPRKTGFILNPASNRYVSRDGPTGLFLRGKGPDPRTSTTTKKKSPRPKAKPTPKPKAKPTPKPKAKASPKPKAKPAPKPRAKPAQKPNVNPTPTPRQPSRPSSNPSLPNGQTHPDRVKPKKFKNVDPNQMETYIDPPPVHGTPEYQNGQRVYREYICTKPWNRQAPGFHVRDMVKSCTKVKKGTGDYFNRDHCNVACQK